MRRLAIWLTAATIATSLVTLFLKPEALGPLPDNVQSPVLAAELVKNAAAIRMVYGDSAKFRGDLETNTICDFFFIASYGGMFFVLGRMAGGKVGWVISAAAVVAALADVAENVGILRTIHAVDATDELALWTRGPSLVKWGLLAVIFVATGLFWMNARGRRLRFVDGLLYLLAGIALGWGLFHPSNMLLAWVPLSAAILIQMVVLIREPDVVFSIKTE